MQMLGNQEKLHQLQLENAILQLRVMELELELKKSKL